MAAEEMNHLALVGVSVHRNQVAVMTIAESTKRYWIALALAACFASSANARDLTGVWQSNGIGTALGTYYIRVNGSDVFWLGESSDAGKSWMNVFHAR